MPSVIDTTGLDRVRVRFERLVNPNASLLMVTFQKLADEDNKRGVLGGFDKDGNKMMAVTYRPKPPTQKKLTANQRNNASARKKYGEFAGIGDHPAGSNNNLTSAEYRLLTGPPLAPRNGFSRVITNYGTRWGRTADSIWQVACYWNEVVSKSGIAFLKYHFNGAKLKNGGWLWKRDLRGIRPEGMQKCRKAANAWMRDQIRSNGA